MKRGTRVFLKGGSPRNRGTIEHVIHRAEGSFCTVRWDNGWRTHSLGFAELAIASNRRHATECDLMKGALRRC